MTIHPAIKAKYPKLNQDQLDAIEHTDGPLLIIAGPGSGKTLCLVLRTLNLLLNGVAKPENIVLCTFTNKATFEMRDRVSSAARDLGYTENLSDLSITTIHGLSNQVLSKYRHRTKLGQNYETLNELTQQLFIFEHFFDIVGSTRPFLGKWSSKWGAIENLIPMLNAIVEERVNTTSMISLGDAFQKELAHTYLRYKQLLINNNKVDYAHLQSFAFELLQDDEIFESISSSIKYAMIDEYQDTNYIQEKLISKLTSRTNNLCVVGDEDQSLYRFRGATVRNILEFKQKMTPCKQVILSTNYRSHKDIIREYDNWMASQIWQGKDGKSFRFDKSIKPDMNRIHRDYPSVFSITSKEPNDLYNRFADFVVFLKSNNIVEDYSQIALLLYSVRGNNSACYFKALIEKKIPYFCPRARMFFEREEIRYILACFAVVFNWQYESFLKERYIEEFAYYIKSVIKELATEIGKYKNLADVLKYMRREVESLKYEMTLDKRPSDYIYIFISCNPFKSALKDQECARNIAIMTQLISVFQQYYHIPVVTGKNKEYLVMSMFNSFFNMLFSGGINEYEDPDQPIPKGFVQIMTIHQAKGLEFSVVVVGSLTCNISSTKQVDQVLSQFYDRSLFEPVSKITDFDRMRLHYVAFSRPKSILALSYLDTPKKHFLPITQGLEQWPYVDKDKLLNQRFSFEERAPVKKSFSFTSDLKIFETCPRQYQFFRDYNFVPSRSAVIFFGQLVHQTIEEIHRLVLDGKLSYITHEMIHDIFERTFSFLLLTDVRPIGENPKKAAYEQVLRYFDQNKDNMHRIVQTEIDVSVEKDGYILTGKVDLLLGGDGKYEILDFKTARRKEIDRRLMQVYEKQLCTYAHIIEQRYNQPVDRLYIYWTGEQSKYDALMEVPYNPEHVREAGELFDSVVSKIMAQNYFVATKPDSLVCKECDLRPYCLSTE